MGKTIAVIIPCHNESPTISEIIKKCLKYTPSVFVIDDGSTDTTAILSRSVGAEVYCHPKNYGYGAAIKTGFAATKNFDIVVTIDGDNQHDANDMPNLINAISDGYDVVIGSRFMKGQSIKIPAYRRFGIWLITLAYNFGHKSITDSQSGFRAYSKKFTNYMTVQEDGFGSVTELLVKARKYNYKIVEVPISCDYHNLAQDSHMNPFEHGLKVIMSVLKWRLREMN